MPSDLTLWSDASTDLVLDWNPAGTGSFFSSTGPTPAMTRAATGPATYFDSNGVLRTAAVNTCLWSEDFSNAAWTKLNVTINTPAILSPDGTLDAQKMVETTATGVHFVYPTSALGFTNPTYWSVYAKAAERTWIRLGMDGGPLAYFDLSAGAVGTVTGATASITPVGSGWFRCALFATSASGSNLPTISCTTGDGVSSHAGVSGYGVYIWGANWVNASTLQPYARTTSSTNGCPRLDYVYNGSTWVNRGMLIEEARTNYVFPSVQHSAYGLVGVTVTDNNAAFLDGTTSANLVSIDTSNQRHIAFKSPTSVPAGAITFSVFLKKNVGSFAHLSIVDSASNRYSIVLSLDSGVVTATQNTGSPTGTTYRIDVLSGGWLRASVTMTNPALGTCTGVYGFADSATPSSWNLGSPTYTGNGVDKMHSCGAQLELGSAASSYIPTTASTATRPADNVSITGNNFAWMVNQLEGTVAVEYDRVAGNTNSRVFSFGDSVVSNEIALYYNTGDSSEHFIVYNSAYQVDVSIGAAFQALTQRKVAAGYKLNDSAVSIGGAAASADTACTIPSNLTQLGIGCAPNNTLQLNGHIGRLRIWGSRYPNATLQQLSS